MIIIPEVCDDIEFSLEDVTRTEKDFACKMIDTAIANNQWFIHLMHGVGTGTYNIDKDVCAEHFAYIGDADPSADYYLTQYGGGWLYIQKLRIGYKRIK